MKKIYLDYAATTPLDPRVFRAMRPYFAEKFGNPGSVHSFGQAAMAAVDAAREKVARAVGADFREIVFTASATEANNLAVQGGVMGFRKMFPDQTPEVIVSAVEHESVLMAGEAAASYGAKVLVLPVKKSGAIDLKKLQQSLSANTAVVSIMLGNNETGALQPVGEAGSYIQSIKRNGWPLFHSDAAQAFQFLPCRPGELDLDLMTLSAHKIYGPKGAGALYIKESAKKLLAPLIAGGGQEFGFRSGTENAPLLAGFGEAAELAVAERDSRTKRVRELRAVFEKELRKIRGVKIRAAGLPHIINFYLPRAEAGDMLAALDLKGVALSSGAACSVRAFRPSHVLRAMGLGDKEIRGSFRASFGGNMTASEVRAAARIIREVYRELYSK